MDGIEKLEKKDYNSPTTCEKCGCRRIQYMGVGEYKCEECGLFMYDDYGKVRNYIEKNPGATTTEVSNAVGVSKEKIRRLLRDDKIQIAPGSVSFLSCEKCGTSIRSGRFCASCQNEVNAATAGARANLRSQSINGGFARNQSGAAGAKRFEKK
ncbi:MAG: hypothetical protein Q4D29_06915 [Lachnospiraceae bacterium]|nr:hypothetical protein [Lachnospiraceae bacterium]